MPEDHSSTPVPDSEPKSTTASNRPWAATPWLALAVSLAAMVMSFAWVSTIENRRQTERRVAMESQSRFQTALTAERAAQTAATVARKVPSIATKLTAEIYRLQREAARQSSKIAEAELKEAKAYLDRDTEYAIIVTHLTAENDELKRRIDPLATELYRLRKSITQKGARGQVLIAQPDWGFAVLNIGDRQGLRPDATLSVARAGQLLGQVKVTSVDSNSSIAEVVPRTFARATTLRPGDTVLALGENKPITTSAPLPPLPTRP